MVPENNLSNFEKLEFWALTTTFVLTLRALLPPYGHFAVVVIQPVAAFVAFMFINFKVVDEVVRGEKLIKNIFILLGFFIMITAANMVTLEFPIDDHILNNAVIEALVIYLAFMGYILVKRVALFIISRTNDIQNFIFIFNRDNLVVLALWMIITYWLLIVEIPTEIWLVWVTLIPTGVILHGLAFSKLIPASLGGKWPLVKYFLMIAIFCVVIGFGLAILLMIYSDDEDRSSTIGVFNGVVHFFMTAPTLWLLYRFQMRGKEQISALQSELGMSAANLDFLRSQINPHFLFNALNTIYGLAIQENAPRTSESVEKLGDMMRFMLLENMQQRILLIREIEYLDNYISLQKLRTDSNTGAKIQVDIQQEISPTTRISPMLLIPFVENAFKHGVSLREESYIKISLELKTSTLYFDVLNSRHPKTENDPEKDSNGIGLANVKHRLQHMYPRKHELLIRETPRDFFVHLQIQLD